MSGNAAYNATLKLHVVTHFTFLKVVCSQGKSRMDSRLEAKNIARLPGVVGSLVFVAPPPSQRVLLTFM